MSSFRKLRPAAALLLAGALAVPLFASSAAYAATPTPLLQASLGDSITRGSAIGGKSSTGGGIDNPKANWSTGTDSRVKSHLQQLQTASKRTVTGSNYAVGGTTSAAIAGQAAKVAAGTSYVTILTGGNDICQASSVANLPTKATYKKQVEAGITTLASRAPQAKVLLGSVPNVVRLYDIAKSDPTGSAVHRSNRVCPVALGTFSTETATQATARRAAVDSRIKEYNVALAELDTKYTQVAYDKGAVYGTPFVLADLSTADYFHPSYTGQAKLAANTWSAVKSSGLLNSVISSGSTTPPPTTPAIKTTVTVVSPTGTVTGTTKLKVSVTSNETITSVKAAVASSTTSTTLTRAADGYYYSPAINTATFPKGKLSFLVEATGKSGAVTKATASVTVQ